MGEITLLGVLAPFVEKTLLFSFTCFDIFVFDYFHLIKIMISILFNLMFWTVPCNTGESRSIFNSVLVCLCHPHFEDIIWESAFLTGFPGNSYTYKA